MDYGKSFTVVHFKYYYYLTLPLVKQTKNLIKLIPAKPTKIYIALTRISEKLNIKCITAKLRMPKIPQFSAPMMTNIKDNLSKKLILHI